MQKNIRDKGLGIGDFHMKNLALLAETSHDLGPPAHRLPAASYIQHKRRRPSTQTRAQLRLHLESREEDCINHQRPHQAWHGIEDEVASNPEAQALKARSTSY